MEQIRRVRNTEGIEEEKKKNQIYNFLTGRYNNLEHRSREPGVIIEPHLNVVLVEEQAARERETQFYGGILTREYLPKKRILKQGHEQYLGIYWDEQYGRYFREYRIPKIKEIVGEIKEQSVWFPQLQRYYPKLSIEEEAFFNLAYDPNENTYESMGTVVPPRPLTKQEIENTRRRLSADRRRYSGTTEDLLSSKKKLIKMSGEIEALNLEGSPGQSDESEVTDKTYSPITTPTTESPSDYDSDRSAEIPQHLRMPTPFKATSQELREKNPRVALNHKGTPDRGEEGKSTPSVSLIPPTPGVPDQEMAVQYSPGSTEKETERTTGEKTPKGQRERKRVNREANESYLGQMKTGPLEKKRDETYVLGELLTPEEKNQDTSQELYSEVNSTLESFDTAGEFNSRGTDSEEIIAQGQQDLETSPDKKKQRRTTPGNLTDKQIQASTPKSKDERPATTPKVGAYPTHLDPFMNTNRGKEPAGNTGSGNKGTTAAETWPKFEEHRKLSTVNTVQTNTSLPIGKQESRFEKRIKETRPIPVASTVDQELEKAQYLEQLQQVGVDQFLSATGAGREREYESQPQQANVYASKNNVARRDSPRNHHQGTAPTPSTHSTDRLLTQRGRPSGFRHQTSRQIRNVENGQREIGQNKETPQVRVKAKSTPLAEDGTTLPEEPDRGATQQQLSQTEQEVIRAFTEAPQQVPIEIQEGDPIRNTQQTRLKTIRGTEASENHETIETQRSTEQQEQIQDRTSLEAQDRGEEQLGPDPLDQRERQERERAQTDENMAHGGRQDNNAPFQPRQRLGQRPLQNPNQTWPGYNVGPRMSGYQGYGRQGEQTLRAPAPMGDPPSYAEVSNQSGWANQSSIAPGPGYRQYFAGLPTAHGNLDPRYNFAPPGGIDGSSNNSRMNRNIRDDDSDNFSMISGRSRQRFPRQRGRAAYDAVASDNISLRDLTPFYGATEREDVGSWILTFKNRLQFKGHDPESRNPADQIGIREDVKQAVRALGASCCAEAQNWFNANVRLEEVLNYRSEPAAMPDPLKGWLDVLQRMRVKFNKYGESIVEQDSAWANLGFRPAFPDMKSFVIALKDMAQSLGKDVEQAKIKLCNVYGKEQMAYISECKTMDELVKKVTVCSVLPSEQELKGKRNPQAHTAVPVETQPPPPPQPGVGIFMAKEDRVQNLEQELANMRMVMQSLQQPAPPSLVYMEPAPPAQNMVSYVDNRPQQQGNYRQRSQSPAPKKEEWDRSRPKEKETGSTNRNRQRDSPSPGMYEPACKFCKKRGHTLDNCWQKQRLLDMLREEELKRRALNSFGERRRDSWKGDKDRKYKERRKDRPQKDKKTDKRNSDTAKVAKEVAETSEESASDGDTDLN